MQAQTCWSQPGGPWRMACARRLMQTRSFAVMRSAWPVRWMACCCHGHACCGPCWRCRCRVEEGCRVSRIGQGLKGAPYEGQETRLIFRDEGRGKSEFVACWDVSLTQSKLAISTAAPQASALSFCARVEAAWDTLDAQQEAAAAAAATAQRTASGRGTAGAVGVRPSQPGASGAQRGEGWGETEEGARA